MDTSLEGGHALTDRGTTDGSVAVNAEVVTQSEDDLLDLLSKLTGRSKHKSLALLASVVDGLENGTSEGGSLAGTRLGLGDDIAVDKQGGSAKQKDKSNAQRSHTGQ